MESVYLDNHLATAQTTVHNLKMITQQLDNGKRTKSTIFAMLKEMGISDEKATFAVNNYAPNTVDFTRVPTSNVIKTDYGVNGVAQSPERNGEEEENYKKNILIMQFNLGKLTEILSTLRSKLTGVIDNNKNKISYSAQGANNIVEKLLSDIHNFRTGLEELVNVEDNSREKYIIQEKMNPALLKIKPEFYFANYSLSQLSRYDDLVSVKEYKELLTEIIKENFYTNYISNLIYEMLNLENNAYYHDAVKDLQYLIKQDENYINENLSIVLNKHNWIPKIQYLLEHNSTKTKKYTSTNDATVEIAYSPVQINEDGSYLFVLDNVYYKVNTDNTLTRVLDNEILNEKFIRITNVLNSFRFNENSLTIYNNKDSLKIEFLDNQFKINEILVEKFNLDNVRNSIIASNFYRFDEVYKVEDLLLVLENLESIKELDIVTRIIGNNGNIINLIKIDESNMYINRISPQAYSNDLYKVTDSEQAQTIVNEYVNFDISKSVYEILSKENKIKTQLNSEKEVYEKRLKFLNDNITILEKENLELNDLGINEAIELLKGEIREHEVKLQNVYTKISNLSK